MTMSTKKSRKSGCREPIVKVVDLYCGIGGLTHGLVLEGFEVVAGVDNDKSCKYAFEKNNRAKFISRDISRFTAKELNRLFDGATVRVLVGCAPCQPYSSLNRKRLVESEAQRRWYPMYRFMTLIKRVMPEIVSMENVPDLSDARKYPVFQEFVETLKALDYAVFFKRVDASRYGVPQRRTRLVLLASRLGADISVIPETHAADEVATVRDAIGSLRRIKDGEIDPRDPLHRASRLDEINRKRIAATPRNGGSATSWPRWLVPKCYRRKSGKSYMVSVYGRMRWEAPASTITTQFMTLGTGRFGHPSQNRAISMREAAKLQTFPDYYQFAPNNEVTIKHTARHIGNAVPVLLGRAIGKSIKRHIRSHFPDHCKGRRK